MIQANIQVIDDTVNVDTRIYNMRKVKSMGLAQSVRWIYPRCIPLHTWLNQQDKQNVPLERLSYDRFDSTGIYWIESHSYIFVWIGKHASFDLVQSLFGVREFSQINPNMNELPYVEASPNNEALRDLYRKSTENVPFLPQLNVIRHGLDLEVELSKVLIEDEVYNQMTYVDCLCMIHKQIQTEVKHESGSCTLHGILIVFSFCSWKETRTMLSFLQLRIGRIDIKSTTHSNKNISTITRILFTFSVFFNIKYFKIQYGYVKNLLHSNYNSCTSF